MRVKTPNNRPPNKPTKRKENPPQEENTATKKVLTPRQPRKAQAKSIPPPPLPLRDPTPPREEDEEYDKQRFGSASTKLLYNEVIKHEEITKFRVFDYKSFGGR